jgi:hypothetical protein
MSTKDLRSLPADTHTMCDVCGRTLLRGENAHSYLDRGAHRTVCELCTGRALEEGWVREGALPAYDNGAASVERRRSLFGRLRRRREAAETPDPVAGVGEGGRPEERNGSAPVPSRRPRREPRHVRAIPSSVEQKIAAAIDAFNGSEHRRTVAGVARSLGPPLVAVAPAAEMPSVVNVVVAWELCWYRYEVDLAEEQLGVRLIAQGDELDELGEAERVANAVCDERGKLALAD